MPRPRRNCMRNSFSSDFSDVDFDNVPILELTNTCSSTRKRTNRQTTKRKRCVIKSLTPKVVRDVNNTVIVLDDSDDDCLSTVISRSRTINENVRNKVEDLFKSSGLLSDDEDGPFLPSANPINETKHNDNTSSSISINEPSSSTCKDRVVDSTSREKVIVLEDDLNEMNTVEDIKNYCKETEDILKNANAILEKFAGTSQIVEEPTKTEISNNKENKNEEKKLECPICYESLSEKQVMTTKCGHLFCKTCIERVATTIKKCPTCRKVVTKKNIIPIYM